MGLYGGGVNVLTAPHPLGPWRNVSASIDPGCPMWKQSTCFEMGPGEVCDPVTQAQQNYVITVPLASGGEWEGGVGGVAVLFGVHHWLPLHVVDFTSIRHHHLHHHHHCLTPQHHHHHHHCLTTITFTPIIIIASPLTIIPPPPPPETAYVWTGDKWQQSPNGNYDQQPQTWLPLRFEGDTLLPLQYVDTFTLDIQV